MSGERAADSRAARNLARVEGVNVVFGAALHAADRLGRGEKPTDLEADLLRVLRAALSEEEIGEWGRVYREAMTARGSVVGVPEVITSRAVSEGFGYADLAGQLETLGRVWSAQSNTALTDREAMAAGVFDSPAFVAGTQQWGFGVTGSALGNGGRGLLDWHPDQDEEAADQEPAPDAGAAGEGGGRSAPQTFSFMLEFENFNVARTVGDGWPTTRDEIRWTSGGSSNLMRAEAFVSQEFGGDKTGTGQTAAFDTYKRKVFQGAASTGLTLNVTCWEVDKGDGNVDSLGEALQTLNQHVLSNPLWAALVELSGSTLLGLLSDLTSFASTVIDLVAKDDRSCTRTVFLDRHDLAVLSHRGRAPWNFNGDGHHTLTVKYSGDKVPFPENTLEYVVRTGDTWGAPIPLPWKSITPPTLAAFGGKLHAMFVRGDDHALMWSVLDGQTWSAPRTVNGWKTYLAPALADFKGKLHCALVGTDNKVLLATYDGASWSGARQIEYHGTVVSPSLAVYSDRLWLTHVGGDGRPFLNTTNNGTAWSPTYGDNIEWVVGHSIAMGPAEGLLWRIVGGGRAGGALQTATSGGSQNWTDRGTIRSWSGTTPALTVHRNTLWILFRAPDNTLRAATRTNGDWTSADIVPGPKPIGGAAAASHNNKLYVMYAR
ncbi:hypothetical protein [Streptomyces sp. NPDC029003]|uniref:hypothetical protein n=1 Tax=Streptomyces sp. NPDC029003 TaxID=3155125 RepID=UPI0033D177ED